MDEHTRFDHKVFFVPDIYINDSGKKYHVGYVDKKTVATVYDAWAGRILPNQTVGQAIRRELREVFGYSGGCMVQAFQEIDAIPDSHNRLTPRYIITLLLDEKIDKRLEVFGRGIVFQEEITQDDVFEDNSVINELPKDDSAVDDLPKDDSMMDELLEDPEIQAILEEYGLLDEYYETKEDVFDALDEIANDWLPNDLSKAEVKDLAETDPQKRKEAVNAKAVKAKIYKVELKMQELDPHYQPTTYNSIRVEDWNPPRNASIEDFYKEFAYYFGDDDSKIDEAANLYIKFHPEAEIEEIKKRMSEFEC